MDPKTIIGLIEAAAKLSEELGPLVTQAVSIANETDAATIRAAAANLAAKNDALHASTQARLRG